MENLNKRLRNNMFRVTPTTTPIPSTGVTTVALDK